MMVIVVPYHCRYSYVAMDEDGDCINYICVTILVYVVYRLRMHVQMIEIDWMDRLLIKC